MGTHTPGSSPRPSPRLRHLVVVAATAFVLGMVSRGLLAGDAAASRQSLSPRSPATAPPTAGGPGPTRIEAGVPVGFARSPEGAVAAAATFVKTGEVVLAMGPAEVESAIRAMAADGAGGAQLADTTTRLTLARQALAGSSAPIDYHQAILSTRVDGFTPESARVSVWNVGVLSREGVAPPQAGWAVSTFDLIWERGDWKVWAETIVPGPAPITNNAAMPATSAGLRERLAGFTSYGPPR